jgi:acetyl-CoA C-acetyltransferase
MGTGPVFAVPKLLARHGLRVNDVGLFELNEALAAQALYCRDRLGIDPERYNVDGAAIAIGHPYGLSGARLVGHALIERKRRGVRYVVCTSASAAAWEPRVSSKCCDRPTDAPCLRLSSSFMS